MATKKRDPIRTRPCGPDTTQWSGYTHWERTITQKPAKGQGR